MRSHIYVSFQHVTLKLCNVTDFKAVSTDFRQLVRQMKKQNKTKQNRETVKFGLLTGQPFFYLILSGIVLS